MNKRISIRFYVAIVTLLLSLPSLADNIVIDKDAMIRMYGRELFNPFKNNTNLYGHITITKDFFTLKIPEQQISVTDTIEREYHSNHHLSMKIYKHTKGEREKGWLTYNIIIS